ncbi:ATP-binding protein [Agromyces italicus]|uniref:ATP-binding protein n=1 Tax=Agromyces italicus TaxID=279572 RepID=UPI001469D9BC|nr:ATP-binding protein [Agromyces italicus]
MTDLLETLGEEFALALPPVAEQYRLTGIGLLNWGTFSGHHWIPVSEVGHVLTGGSGHGKSTILDAVSVVMFPPNGLDLNAAARDATAKGKDRNILSYIRGAYGSLPDAEGNPVTQFLRNGNTWSALSLEFTHPQHGPLTLIRVFRASETATRLEQVPKAGMIVEGKFHLPDLKEIVTQPRLEMKALQREFDPIHVSAEFTPYQERFMRLLGLTQQAMDLLGKMQANKGLSSLEQLTMAA